MDRKSASSPQTTLENLQKSMEWIESILFAVIAVTLIRTFIFGMYVIPTSSMEKTLLVGDYLYVSKVAYGPTMPNTPLSFPLVHHTMPLSQTKNHLLSGLVGLITDSKGWDISNTTMLLYLISRMGIPFC